jgi:hypothetical protein
MYNPRYDQMTYDTRNLLQRNGTDCLSGQQHLMALGINADHQKSGRLLQLRKQKLGFSGFPDPTFTQDG